MIIYFQMEAVIDLILLILVLEFIHISRIFTIMIKIVTAFIFSTLLSLAAFSQTIECVDELVVGSGSSIGRNSTLFNNEIYFVNAQFDLFRYNDNENSYDVVDDLELSFSNVFEVMSNEEAIFYFAGSFLQDVYFTDGNSGSERRVVAFDGEIEQASTLDLGLVVIESNFSDGLKNGYFIDNLGSDTTRIMSGVDNTQDFSISESRNIAIISRVDEEDFDGGVFFYDTSTGVALSDDEVIADATGAITEARGFTDHIFYRSGSSSFIYSHDTGSSQRVSVSNDDVKDTGETSDYLFLAFTFGSLERIEKATLSSREIAKDMSIFPEFSVLGDSIYYVNGGNIELHNGTRSSVFSADIGGNDNLLQVEFLNGQVHALVQSRPFSNDIYVLNEVDAVAEIIPDLSLPSSVDFHLVNESIIFTSTSPDKGLEFFRLFYEPSANNELISKRGISIFPNPVSDRLSIDIMNYSGTVRSYVISNIYGQSIWQDAFQSTIDVSGLYAGTYFISLLFDDQEVVTLKYSKQ